MDEDPIESDAVDSDDVDMNDVDSDDSNHNDEWYKSILNLKYSSLNVTFFTKIDIFNRDCLRLFFLFLFSLYSGNIHIQDGIQLFW